MATYKEIQEYVKEEHGASIKTCWIAHIKEVCGLRVEKAHNRYDKDKRANPCPENKKKMIEEAFRHFGMIK